MNRIQTKEIELSYEDVGDGQPVVFVHGSLSDSRNWDQHRGMITAQSRMIAPTQRYFGVSPWPDDGRNFSIQTHADDLERPHAAASVCRRAATSHFLRGSGEA